MRIFTRSIEDVVLLCGRIHESLGQLEQQGYESADGSYRSLHKWNLAQREHYREWILGLQDHGVEHLRVSLRDR